jgi:hypothetical protein
MITGQYGNGNRIKLTPWSTVLLEKLTVPQTVNKFLAFYETRRFITVVTKARHMSTLTAT